MDCTGNCHPSHHHSYCLAGCTDNRHIQPFLHPEKFVRGDTRPDPGCDEKTAGHDRAAARCIEKLCKVRAGDLYQGHCHAGCRCDRRAGDLNKVEVESRSIFGRLLAVAENYPDLKTSQSVTSLMDSVKSLEDEISRHRYTYNPISQEFNTMMDTIPSSFIGHLAHLSKLEYLQFEEEIKTSPKIEF